MNVILAVHHFPPAYLGGAEWRAYRTAARLQARGHRVQVVSVESILTASNGPLSVEMEEFRGIRTHRLSFDLKGSPDPFRWSYDNPWIADYIGQLLTESDADLFHLIGGYLIGCGPLWKAKAANVPTVLSLTDYWFFCPRISMIRSSGKLSTLPIEASTCAQCLGEESRRFKLARRLFPRLMRSYWRWREGETRAISRRIDFLRQSLEKADVILSPSRFVQSVYVQAGAPEASIRFMRQGVDLGAGTPKRKSLEPGIVRVGYIGQIARHKGVHVLLQALRILADAAVSVSIFGDLSKDPDYGREIKRHANEDSRVKLAGAFERSEIARVMAGLDLVVVPSLWYENSPNVILEAFASGTPVLASDLGGMSELVEHGVNGFLFEAGNPRELAGRLLEVADDHRILDKLTRGIPEVKSVDQEMDELEQVYRELANGRAGPAEEKTS